RRGEEPGGRPAAGAGAGAGGRTAYGDGDGAGDGDRAGKRKTLATPATRRVARELGVDLYQVEGSGPAGRITSDDVRAFSEGGGRAPAPREREAAAAGAPARAE